MDETIKCVGLLRELLPGATVSVEVEKPGREGLVDLASEADVVFYSKTWAEASEPQSPGEDHPLPPFRPGIIAKM